MLLHQVGAERHGTHQKLADVGPHCIARRKPRNSVPGVTAPFTLGPRKSESFDNSAAASCASDSSAFAGPLSP